MIDLPREAGGAAIEVYAVICAGETLVDDPLHRCASS